MNISNNVSSLLAHQKMMNVTANNVANVNTDGFVPSDARIVNTGDSVTESVRKADSYAPKNSTQTIHSQTDLAKEIPDMIVSSGATSFNVTAIKTQDEMLGSLLDMKG